MEATEYSPTITVTPFPDKKAERATAIVNFARSIVVTDQRGYEHASMELRTIKAMLNEAEEDRKFIVKPLNDHVKAINDRFRTALTEPLAEAERAVKATMTAFVEHQERLRAKEAAKAAQIAREAREKAEADAREAERRAKIEADRQRREAEDKARAAEEAARLAREAREREEAARLEGDKKAAREAAKEAERLENERREQEAREAAARAAAEETERKAAEEAREAHQRATLAAVVPTPAVEAPKAAGVSFRSSYEVTVTDPAALRAAVCAGTVPGEALTPDLKFLKRQATAYEGRLAYPGVTVTVNKILSSRS